MAEVNTLEEKLAEVLGLAQAAQGTTRAFRRRTRCIRSGMPASARAPRKAGLRNEIPNIGKIYAFIRRCRNCDSA